MRDIEAIDGELRLLARVWRVARELSGCTPSTVHGSVGDAYDNALAETTIGLFKTEAVGRGSPFLAGPLRTLDDVAYATMEWVDWYNNRRMHSQLDYVPPEEHEAAYYAQT
jgi:putative transposase